MSRTRKQFSSEFKAKVALEAAKGYKSINEIARENEIHPNVVQNWKKQFLENLPIVFENKRGPKSESEEELVSKLYQQIGKLQVELDWLKKKLNSVG